MTKIPMQEGGGEDRRVADAMYAASAGKISASNDATMIPATQAAATKKRRGYPAVLTDTEMANNATE
jgi:hypothetical protein